MNGHPLLVSNAVGVKHGVLQLFQVKSYRVSVKTLKICHSNNRLSYVNETAVVSGCIDPRECPLPPSRTDEIWSSYEDDESKSLDVGTVYWYQCRTGNDLSLLIRYFCILKVNFLN